LARRDIIDKRRWNSGDRTPKVTNLTVPHPSNRPVLWYHSVDHPRTLRMLRAHGGSGYLEYQMGMHRFAEAGSEAAPETVPSRLKQIATAKTAAGRGRM
jgi:hypothetical protein